MKKAETRPGLISELGSIAGLYKTVFWMMGRRAVDGPGWEERIAEQSLRPYMEQTSGFANQPYEGLALHEAERATEETREPVGSRFN